MKIMFAIILLASVTQVYAGVDCSPDNIKNLNKEDTALCGEHEKLRQLQRSGQSADQAASNASASAACTELGEKAKKTVEQKGNMMAEGTDTFFQCIKLSKGNFRELFKKGSRNSTQFSWKNALLASDKCVSVAVTACGKAQQPQPPEAVFKQALDKCAKSKEMIELAAKCDAAAYIISTEHELDSAEDSKPDTFKDAASGITCNSKGIETLDYAACVKFAQNANLMDAAQGAIQKGQELYYADKTMSAQADAARSDNTATAALEALKTGVKGQKEIMEQRAALDTGKFAALTSMYLDMPDKDTLKKKCPSYNIPREDFPELSIDPCITAITNQPSFGFLMNPMAKEKMKAKLVKVGIDVGSDAVMAGLMAKREGDLNNAIANVNSFQPIDPVAPQLNNTQTTLCQTNPGDPQCLTGGLDRTFDTMNDNVITFGEGGTGTTYANANPFTDSSSPTSNAVSPTNRNSITGVGGTIAAAQQSGGLADPLAAGAVTKGGGPSGGGGGGGGGSSGGGGGGGGAAPGAQNPGGVTAAIQGKTPNYGGGTGFSLVGGGNGLRNSKSGSAKEDNPFGKLFNKNGNANGAVNFREIASKVGPKTDNLFDMISKRYSSVSNEKRLIEYEQAK